MLDKIALTLLVIGGLNWGSIGLFQFDVIAWIGGGTAGVVSRVLYVLVGLSAIWGISLLFREPDRDRDRDRIHDGRVTSNTI